MSRLVNAVVVGMAAFVVLAGVVWYVAVASREDKVVADVTWRVESVDAEGANVVADVVFRNQLDAELEFLSADVTYTVAGIDIASNVSDGRQPLRAKESMTVPMRLFIPTEIVAPFLRDHLHGGEESSVVLEGAGVFQLGTETVEIPVKKSWDMESGIEKAFESKENCPGKASDPCLAKVEASWETEGDEVFLATRLHVRNMASDELRLNATTVRLRFGGSVVSEAEAPGAVVAGDRVQYVDVRLFLGRAEIAAWWLEHVGRCEASPVSVDVDFGYEVGSEEDPGPSPTTTSPSPTNTTRPTPTNSTSPSPTNTSKPPREQTEYRYAAAQPQEGGMAWRMELGVFRTRVVCEN